MYYYARKWQKRIIYNKTNALSLKIIGVAYLSFASSARCAEYFARFSISGLTFLAGNLPIMNSPTSKALDLAAKIRRLLPSHSTPS